MEHAAAELRKLLGPHHPRSQLAARNLARIRKQAMEVLHTPSVAAAVAAGCQARVRPGSRPRAGSASAARPAVLIKFFQGFGWGKKEKTRLRPWR